MESFFVALNAVLPMFIMLFIGFLVRKLKILQDSFLPQLNKIVFNVFFPELTPTSFQMTKKLPS